MPLPIYAFPTANPTCPQSVTHLLDRSRDLRHKIPSQPRNQQKQVRLEANEIIRAVFPPKNSARMS